MHSARGLLVDPQPLAHMVELGKRPPRQVQRVLQHNDVAALERLVGQQVPARRASGVHNDSSSGGAHFQFLALMFSSSTAWKQYTLPDVFTATMCVDSVNTCER